MIVNAYTFQLFSFMFNRENGSVEQQASRPFEDELSTDFSSINNVSWNETGFQVYYELVFYNEKTGWKEYLDYGEDTKKYVNVRFGQMI